MESSLSRNIVSYRDKLRSNKQIFRAEISPSQERPEQGGQETQNCLL